jgi:hypothetical protein
MDISSHEIRDVTITPEILKLIAEIDEFKGRWKAMKSLAPEKAHDPEADRHDLRALAPQRVSKAQNSAIGKWKSFP